MYLGNNYLDSMDIYCVDNVDMPTWLYLVADLGRVAVHGLVAPRRRGRGRGVVQQQRAQG